MRRWGNLRPLETWLVPLLVLAGLVTTAIAYRIAYIAEERRVQSVLDLRVEWRAKGMEEKLQDAQDALTATAVYVASEKSITLEDFRRFVSGANSAHRPIAALDWVPRVRRDQREAFEAAARQSGQSNFKIVERNPQGELVRAADRDEYLPVLMQWKFEAFQSAAGFDISSTRNRAATAVRARDTGLPQATPSVEAAVSSEPTYIVFWPIYETIEVPLTVAERRTQLRGYVVGVFRTLTVLNVAIENTPDILESIAFYMSAGDTNAQPQAPASPVAIFSPSLKKIVAASSSVPESNVAYRASRSFDVMGVRWRLDSSFSPEAVAANRSLGPISILIAGVLATIVFAAYVRRERRQLSEVQEIVRHQTRELTLANDRLRTVFEASPIALATYDAENRVTTWNRATENLTGYSAEEVMGRPLPSNLSSAFAELTTQLESVSRGEIVRDLEVTAFHKDGTPFEVIVSIAGLFGAGGAFQGIITAAENVTEHRAAYKKLRETQTLMSAIVSSSDDAMISKDLDGIVTTWNKGAEQIFGYSAEEMIGHPISVIAAPGREDDMITVLNRIKRGERIDHYETQRRRKDGAIVDVSLTVSPIHDSEGRIIGASKIARDVTEQKRAQEHLRLSEARLRMLVEKAPDAILVYDADREEFIDANAQAEILFGVSREELIKLGPTHFYTSEQPDGRPIEQTFAERVGRTLGGEELFFERRIRDRAGNEHLCEVRPVDLPTLDGRLIRTSFLDITERRRAEAALRESELKYRNTFDIAPVGIIHLSAQSDFLMVNDFFCNLLGYEREELLATNVMAITDPEDLADSKKRFEDVGSFGLSSGTIVKRYLHKNGRSVWCEVTFATQRDETGQRPYIISIVSDISARKAAEEQQQKLSAQLQQSQKMEAIGQLTGGMAHDFNNLLGIIVGNLDILQDRQEPGSDQRMFTETAIHAATRGAELTRQLLAFARQQPLAPKVVDVNAVLEASAQLLRRTLGEHVTLDLKLSPELWPLLVDPSQLESAILNLAVNARDAMPGGGTLTVEARNVSLDEGAAEANPEAVSGDYVAIAVSDTGTGMAPEVMAKAFDPFFSTKGNKGSGLGLSMVHGFIKQSGGHSKIYSEPGRGTTIRLYLPRAENVVSEAVVELSGPNVIGGGEIILVVEDNEELRNVAVHQLQDLGYRTIPASDAAWALKMIEGGTPIDLLFTDVVMPGGMDGTALADAARRLRPDLKVLFTSGFTAAAASAAMADEFGFNLLSKPYRKEELGRRVRAALDGVGL
jgi:PAS domain S-box-containing protein